MAEVRRPSTREATRGAVLIFSVLLIFVLMGLTAVVVDLGIARATQLQLQASADAAAVEGLRARDAKVATSSELELARRLRAAQAAALVFDDNADLASEGAVAYRLGAGPTLATGVGGIDDPAGGLLTDSGPFVPGLQLNLEDNRREGDLVAGTYEATDPADAGRNDWHVESSNYERLDFTPATTLDTPAPSFLARTRRTRDVDGLDRVPGVSSSGPTLPYLFGLGSAVLSAPKPDVYDPRRDGVTVRGTAIANAEPAVIAGMATENVTGLAPIALDATDPTLRRWLGFELQPWSALPAGAQIVFDVIAVDGTIVGVDGGPSPSLVGGALRVRELEERGLEGARVGDVVDGGAVVLPGTGDDVPLGRFYVGLYTTVVVAPDADPDPSSDLDPAPGLGRLCFCVNGFAAITIASASPAPGGGGALRVVGIKSPSIVAPANASAVRSLAANVADLELLSAGAEPLLAPVLAR
ncbi:MAG: Tad domain-containing protein [Planctomycetota bacterium]